MLWNQVLLLAEGHLAVPHIKSLLVVVVFKEAFSLLLCLYQWKCSSSCCKRSHFPSLKFRKNLEAVPLFLVMVKWGKYHQVLKVINWRQKLCLVKLQFCNIAIWILE